MIDIELFEEFKTYCKDYEIVLGNLIVKNNDNMFILYKPQGKEELIYEVIYGNRRMSGSTSDIDELIEAAKDAVGNMIKINEKGKYF